MSYTQFANKMLLALYYETGGDREELIPIAGLGKKFGIELTKPFWLRDLKEEWASLNLASFPHDGTGATPNVSITLHGIRQAEALPSDLLPAIQLGESQPEEVVILESGVTQVDFAQVDFSPASDRMVPLDHNSVDYQNVAQELNNLRAELHRTNDAGESGQERDRLVDTLDSAIKLWSSAQLKVIQIKVGVLMAVQDVGTALQKAGKSIAWGIIQDLIKSYVKNKIGVDF